MQNKHCRKYIDYNIAKNITDDHGNEIYNPD